jgi:D-galactarolactone cycloisomerase
MQLGLERIEAKVYRVPIGTPVRTSFGTMRDRPAVLVRVVDSDGDEGWGEVWCNFPSVGAEHRARLLRDVIAPVALEESFETPVALFERLQQRLHVLTLQTGEHGPVAQVLAGLDIAVWDLAARKENVPIHVLLGAERKVSVPAYASGLNPDRPEDLAAARQAEGHRAFKLKVGFGEELDIANLKQLRKTLGDEARLMVDANQGWDLETAIRMASKLMEFGPDWLEEPLPVDRPVDEWQRLAQASPIPLAGGENMRDGDFTAALDARYLSVLQPDLGKWGGFTRCVPIGRKTLDRGMRFCPHWLGGGVGLLASAHLLAAVGGNGMVEVDANPNPLRANMLDQPVRIEEGRIMLPTGPGLGAVPDIAAIERFEVQF